MSVLRIVLTIFDHCTTIVHSAESEGRAALTRLHACQPVACRWAWASLLAGLPCHLCALLATAQCVRLNGSNKMFLDATYSNALEAVREAVEVMK